MMLYSRNSEIELSTDLVQALQLRFPKKAVDDELCKAALWLTRYEKRRPLNIWRFIDNWLERSPDVRQPAPVIHAWWSTDARTLNQGAAIDVNPRPGESMQEYRARISERMRA